MNYYSSIDLLILKTMFSVLGKLFVSENTNYDNNSHVYSFLFSKFNLHVIVIFGFIYDVLAKY